MENNSYQPILDAYQLVEGALIKGKDQEEIFKIGDYDADKRAYTAHPLDEHGEIFDDFSVLISEDELMDNYLINTTGEDDDESDDELLSDSI